MRHLRRGSWKSPQRRGEQEASSEDLPNSAQEDGLAGLRDFLPRLPCLYPHWFPFHIFANTSSTLTQEWFFFFLNVNLIMPSTLMNRVIKIPHDPALYLSGCTLPTVFSPHWQFVSGQLRISSHTFAFTGSSLTLVLFLCFAFAWLSPTQQLYLWALIW